ncbi:MAG: nucleotide pyrophosphohydrolase [Prevotella sp.]|nr:nucleotide pyrophosphohydrolase [Prevotella sp.]
MTIREAQKMVDEWIKTYGVRYFSELTNMAILTEEVGEVARIISREYGDQSFKEGEKTDLGDELADVLWVLMCLANQTGVDLTEALKKNIEKKTSRDKTRHITNEKLKNKRYERKQKQVRRSFKQVQHKARRRESARGSKEYHC